MIILLTTSMYAQEKHAQTQVFCFPKKTVFKNSFFQDKREKLKRKDSIGLEIVALRSGALI